MIFQLAGVVFTYGPPARRLARLMYRLAATRDQIMPLLQRLTRCPQAISTGAWKPIKASQVLAVELHAVCNQLHSVLVLDAAPIAPVEEPASNIGCVEKPCLFVLELVNAAPAAAVAKSFPLGSVQAVERLLPEGRSFIHLK
jgi:hypothetical protein